MNPKQIFLLFLLLAGCAAPETKNSPSFYKKISALESIKGKSQYLASPFVAAGDRVYLVGHQDGSFPDIGWHITGEMGGIWDHPIKLMDGFTAAIKTKEGNEVYCLNNADQFTNFPIGNSHHFTWAKENIEIDRVQFIPDGVEGAIVEFTIHNRGQQNKELIFSFTGMIDLRPTWLGERTKMVDAEDQVTFDDNLSAVVGKDKDNPWHVAFGSSRRATVGQADDLCPKQPRKGLGKDATLSYSISVNGKEEIVIQFYIAGSYQSEDALRANYDLLKTQGQALLEKKMERFKKISEASHLTIPDKEVERMYGWLKYNTDWLTRNVPEQGRGLSAGLPDYPWWFGADATYALQGVLVTGDHQLAKSTILLLHQLSKKTNSNGRIVHEVSTNGSVYNAGNVNETAQFITLVNTYYAWTGDKELVSQLFPDLKKGIEWLLREKDPDGNRYPNGSGMMEIPGLESELEMIDVAVYTQQAVASAASLATSLGDITTASEYQKIADELKVKIDTEWWQPKENSFGDFRGTVAEAIPVLNAALIRSDTLGKTWAVEELKTTKKNMAGYLVGKRIPHVIYHNWVVNTPMETGIADSVKARAALKKAKTYENAFGAFVTGIDRTEEADSVVLKSRTKIFSYTGAVMTLPTSVLAVGAARYAGADEALHYVKKLQQSFSYALPGSMYEVSPDFGMMTQAWNIYGVAVPLVNYIFGIQPKAFDKSAYLSPQLPVSWKDASIENVKIGANSLSLTINLKNDYKEYHIIQTIPDWNIFIDVKKAKRILVNDKEVAINAISNNWLKISGKELVVKIY
jgi:hypothetical protein